MEKDVLAALITAIASLFAATIAAVVSFISARRASTATQKMERDLVEIRALYERRLESIQLAGDVNKELKAYIGSVWSHIQTIKDVIGELTSDRNLDKTNFADSLAAIWNAHESILKSTKG